METTFSKDTYRTLSSHVRNTVAMCRALKRLQTHEAARKTFLQDFQTTVVEFRTHVQSILLLSKGLPEEEKFNEYCGLLALYGEENPCISTLSERLTTFYKEHLHTLFHESIIAG